MENQKFGGNKSRLSGWQFESFKNITTKLMKEFLYLRKSKKMKLMNLVVIVYFLGIIIGAIFFNLLNLLSH